MCDGLVRALFEILLYAVGVWHGTRLAKHRLQRNDGGDDGG